MSRESATPLAGPSGSRRLKGIEGLRAIAATAVVLYHVWLYGGTVGVGTRAETVFFNLALGVTLFFALSGFLLYRPFAGAIARGTAIPSIGNYLRNRALRILPAYWVILIIVSLALQTASTRADDGSLALGMPSLFEMTKCVLLIQDYTPNSIVVGIGPAWSLAVEVVFYLLLPVLVLACVRGTRHVPSRHRRVLTLMLPPLLLLIIGLTGKYVAGEVVPGSPSSGYNADWHSVVERSFWAQADLFSFGMVAAVLHTEAVDGRLRLPHWWRPAAAVIAVAMFVLAANRLGRGQLSYLPENTVVAASAALLLVIVTFPGHTDRAPIPQRVLEWKVFVLVGLISYSIFLWNEPVMNLVAERGAVASDWGELTLMVALVFCVVTAISVLTYRYVELPALRRKRKPRAIDAAQLEAAP